MCGCVSMCLFNNNYYYTVLRVHSIFKRARCMGVRSLYIHVLVGVYTYSVRVWGALINKSLSKIFKSDGTPTPMRCTHVLQLLKLIQRNRGPQAYAEAKSTVFKDRNDCFGSVAEVTCACTFIRFYMY